jgi:hypothetical protein
MGEIEALFQAFDPLRPLEADEDLLYVDWQRRLEPDGADAKSRLAREFVRNATPERPIVRLLTGHKGSGKTTELHRVASQLRDGSRGQKVFVSTLYAQRWLDIEDIEPEDLVLQIVRQLVADLKAAGMDLAEQEFKHGLGALWDRIRQIRVDKVDVNIDPLKVSFALQDFPTARREFRELLRGQLTTVYDLVNNTLLPAARKYVRDELDCADIVLIVDDLDKMSQRTLPDRPATNQEELFLENAATLQAIRCSMLLTIPIELAYSPAQGRLRDEYGASIASVPLISVTDRRGEPTAGRPAMVEILGRRASKGFGDDGLDAASSAQRLFAEPELVEEVVRLSGGHVRSLLVMITALLSRVDELPIGAATFQQCAREEARSLTKGLFPADRAVLAEVARTHEALEDPRFFALLRNLYVFAYETGADEDWYGLNPLLPAPAGGA